MRPFLILFQKRFVRRVPVCILPLKDKWSTVWSISIDCPYQQTVISTACTYMSCEFFYFFILLTISLTRKVLPIVYIYNEDDQWLAHSKTFADNWVPLSSLSHN